MRALTPGSAPPAPTAPSQTEVPSDASGPPQHHGLLATDTSETPRHHHALEIPEILENILIRLPVLDLFVQQTVSKRFQVTMAQSPAIQRMMFLALSNAPREHWRYVCTHRREGTRKRLDNLAFEVADPITAIPRDGALTTPVTLNPFLEVFLKTTRSNSTGVRRKYLTYSRNEHVRLQLAVQSVVGRHSSLLTTYISDPPCKVAEISVTFTIQTPRTSMLPQYRPHSLYCEDIKVRSETGLKLSDLWDAAMDASGDYRWKCPYGVIRSRQVPRLRDVLKELREPSVSLSGMMDIELCDVVVPTAEERAAVR
jgi:hypothetical protein